MIAALSPALHSVPGQVPSQPVVSILGIDAQTVAWAAALLDAGFRVVCADSDIDRIDTLNQRIALGIGTPVMNSLRMGQASGELEVGDDIFAAVMNSNVTVICQRVASDGQDAPNALALSAIGRTIGTALRLKPGFHIIVEQSASLPAGSGDVLVPAIEAASGLKAGAGFALVH